MEKFESRSKQLPVDIEKKQQEYLEELKKGKPKDVERRIEKSKKEIDIVAFQEANREYLLNPDKFLKKPELKDFTVGEQEKSQLLKERENLSEIYRKQTEESLEKAITTEDIDRLRENVKKQAQSGKGGPRKERI